LQTRLKAYPNIESPQEVGDAIGEKAASDVTCLLARALRGKMETQKRGVMITGVNHTSFTVSDVNRSVSFYRDLLGLKLISLGERDPAFSEKVTGIPGAHLKVAYLQARGHRLELIQYLNPPGKKLETRTNNVGSAHLAFNVDDLPRLFADLKAKGVQFKSAPVEVLAGPNKGTLTVYFTDPDGITLELLQAPAVKPPKG